MSQIIIFFCFLFVVTANAEYQYKTKQFIVPLDHNNFLNNESLGMKFLENDDYWDRSGGPIFFFTGSEGLIEEFANITGFVWEIAPEFKAKIVFAEHRYYGESMPLMPLMPEHGSDDDEFPIGYLSITQALSDFANLLYSMKGGTKYPVIAFGASYSGMLSAYMRMKYPHIVAGAIASSAPIHNNVPCDTFPKSVTSTFALANANCSINIRNSWDVIKNFTKDANNYDWLTTNWKLCDPIKGGSNVHEVLTFLQLLYENLAMLNYPYPADFIAEPVRSACQYLSELLTGQPLLECCTEIPQICCPSGVDDMFSPLPFNPTVESEECYNYYGVRPSYNWAEVEFGGARLQAASNIVFSNGLLDPWAEYGILQNVSKTVQVVIMNDTAHGMDLLTSNAADPPSVRAARQFHKLHIKKWIRSFRRVQTKNSSNSV